MTDEEAARDAARLAKQHVPPYLRVSCDCQGGKVVVLDASPPQGRQVLPCRWCDGRRYTWAMVPEAHGPRLSDRSLIKELST